ncbi:MAG: hypothetical protein ACK412_02900 [Chloroherpetonaceae bacterium]
MKSNAVMLQIAVEVVVKNLTCLASQTNGDALSFKQAVQGHTYWSECISVRNTSIEAQ